jgi:leucyl-tRNA synthetase
MAWNERALHGMRRFVDRFERWVMDNAGNRGGSSPLVKRVTNRLGKNVGDDIAAFKFNTALAKIMEALNTVSNAGEQIAPAHLEAWLRILAPFAPFLAERGWQKLGKAGSVHDTAWPAYDPKLDSEQKVEVPVMVNGKLRATVWIDLDEEEAAVQEKARSLEGVAKYLDAGKVEKIVYVPGKAINFVIRG